MINYNLIEQPWIPCQDLKGNLINYSLKEVLENAHNLAAIVEESPLAVAGIYRLIIAVIHRSINGPQNKQDWSKFFHSNGFPPQFLSQIMNYLEEWKGRFDIFDPLHPFYQVGDLDASKSMSITKIAPQLSSGNNATLFDHTYDDIPPNVTYGQAIRWLIGYNGYSLGGLITPYASPRLTITDKTSKSAPLAKAALVIIQGSNLYQTLILNLIKYNPSEGEPYPIENEDKPAWEKDDHTEPIERMPDGYLDWLTWQARSMRLILEDDNSIKRVVVMTGYSLPESMHRKNYETMIGFKSSLQTTSDPFPAIGFSKNRVIWRDFAALSHTISAGAGSTSSFPPKILLWIADMYEAGIIDRKDYPILLYGAGSDKASFEFWRTEAFPFDLDFLIKDEYFDLLSKLVAIVEKGGDALRSANNILIKESVSDIRQKLKTKGILEKKDNDRIKQRMSAINLEGQYWGRMVEPFKNYLLKIVESSESARNQILAEWLDKVKYTGKEILDSYLNSSYCSAQAFKASTKAQNIYSWRFHNGS